jgi:hypothetical protein
MAATSLLHPASARARCTPSVWHAGSCSRQAGTRRSSAGVSQAADLMFWCLTWQHAVASVAFVHSTFLELTPVSPPPPPQCCTQAAELHATHYSYSMPPCGR